VDPLASKYPELTPFQFASNTPIQAVDLDGAEAMHYWRVSDDKGNTTALIPSHQTDIVDNPWASFFGLEEPKINTRKEYVVHQYDTEHEIESVYGRFPNKYEEAVTFGTLDAAAASTDTDFRGTSGDMGHYLQQGVNNVGQATKENGGPIVRSGGLLVRPESMPKKLGGRLGSISTRNQIDGIAKELESRGYIVTHGGRTSSGKNRPEEWLPPKGGGRKGGSYTDLTAKHPDYPTVRINTVTTLKDGKTPTKLERRNGNRIRSQIAPKEHLLLIPKN
jgi:hypothetical protein